jgi:hypothetical protein
MLTMAVFIIETQVKMQRGAGAWGVRFAACFTVLAPVPQRVIRARVPKCTILSTGTCPNAKLRYLLHVREKRAHRRASARGNASPVFVRLL